MTPIPYLPRILGPLVCCVFLGLIQYVYFGVVQNLWYPKPPVDRYECRCPCWDTVFKGGYEYPNGSYKHIYFNVTSQAFKMWILTVCAILITYEVCCHVVRVLLSGQVRFSMLILFLSTVHSHYYSWWMFWGYLNDDFYFQWNHQLMFTLTEGISTAVVLYLLDSDVTIKSQHLLIIISIAILHIAAGGIDQFVRNIIFFRGRYHQIARDAAFMSVDFLILIISMKHLSTYLNENGLSLSGYLSKNSRDVLLAALFVISLFLISTKVL